MLYTMRMQFDLLIFLAHQLQVSYIDRTMQQKHFGTRGRWKYFLQPGAAIVGAEGYVPPIFR